MLNKTYKILGIFVKEPWKKFTFKEIKAFAKSKSESYVYGSLNDFVKDDILKKENIGDAVVYSLRDNHTAILNISVAAEFMANDAKQVPKAGLYSLMSLMPTKFFTSIITGSYARNKQTKDSDLDVVIISGIDSKKIYAELKHPAEMSIPPIHLYVFTEQEFLQMLSDRNPNYGKEISKNNLIIAGAESYYKLIMEAMKNGFNG